MQTTGLAAAAVSLEAFHQCLPGQPRVTGDLGHGDAVSDEADDLRVPGGDELVPLEVESGQPASDEGDVGEPALPIGGRATEGCSLS